MHVYYIFSFSLFAFYFAFDRVSTEVSVYQNTAFSLKILNSWCCKVKVSEMEFNQKFFSSHPVVSLCVSDSEIIATNVFAKRRQLFVPFLRFHLLRFSYSCFDGTFSSTGFHSLFLQWGSGCNWRGTDDHLSTFVCQEVKNASFIIIPHNFCLKFLVNIFLSISKQRKRLTFR